MIHAARYPEATHPPAVATLPRTKSGPSWTTTPRRHGAPGPQSARSRLGIVLRMPTRACLAVLVLATACNVVQWQQASLVASLRERGLASREVALDGATVRVWTRAGEGTPVMLLHGFGTAAHWQWGEQVRALEGRPIVMPDLLWFGRSTSRARDFSLDHQVRAVAGLLGALGHAQVDVVGLSYGGMVAVELATAHPSLVRRLVVVDSPGRAFSRADHAALLARYRVDHIGRVMIPERDEDVRRMMDAAYAHPPPAPDFVLPQIREAFFPPRRRADLYAVLDALVRDLDVLRARPDPRVPALVVWGSDDPIFPLSLAHRLRRRLGPGTGLAVIDDARHTPNLERPDAFNRILLEFLADP